ncbi:MAG TPA: PSD1 and planctomycete cytochrome C domain-containing protein [Gemmataceae bacterium]|jgi:hypothetical protein|nr:PSD1 and planctomycete cytochrome C domain-containing protein [Gemmataceae bacterium]
MAYVRYLCACVSAALVAFPVCADDTGKKIDFAHDIVPIIKKHCGECHTNGKRKGSLSLDTRESTLKAKVVVPGKSGDSELLKRILSDDPDERMPPEGNRLAAKEVELIKAWIDQGLPWQPGFSFLGSGYFAPLKLRKITLPPGQSGHTHPIDRILDVYYTSKRVPQLKALDDVAFIRRLYLDLIGLLPAPEELKTFLADKSPDRRDRLIRRVLSDKRAYADHWLTFWNDMLRNDYQGTGYIDGGRKQISAWLYQSLLENKPYNRFVGELISPTAESEGFIKGIQWRGRVNASQVREIQFSQNVSQVFFGINMKCASCHDSFIDTWRLSDAYGLAAIIAEHPLEIYRCDKPTGTTASPKFLWSELGSIDATLPKAERLERLAALVTHPDNGRFSRTIVNRIWQRLFGHGIVHPVDVMANKPWNEDLLDYLAGYLVEHGYDLKELLAHIVSSRAYQSHAAVVPSESSTEDYVFRGPEVKRMTAEQFVDAVWMITRAGPTKPAAPIKLPAFDAATPKERQFIRASLVNADALLRSLGRPNREQVVTTRSDMLTTLEALDLSNGQILTDTLLRGANDVLQRNRNASDDKLIKLIYLQALCRQPADEELATGRQILGSPASAESLADFLWAVFMLPEFQLVR